MTASGQRVYDPRGLIETRAHRLASRPRSLEGLRLGVLDNSKWNAHRLLDSVVARMAQQDFLEVRYYKKESFLRSASSEQIERIVSETDVVLTAVGD